MSLICSTIAAADPTIGNIDVVIADFSSQPVFSGLTGRAVTQRMRADICEAPASGADRVSGTVHKFDQGPKGQAENGDLLKSNMLQEQTSLQRDVKEKS